MKRHLSIACLFLLILLTLPTDILAGPFCETTEGGCAAGQYWAGWPACPATGYQPGLVLNNCENLCICSYCPGRSCEAECETRYGSMSFQVDSAEVARRIEQLDCRAVGYGCSEPFVVVMTDYGADCRCPAGTYREGDSCACRGSGTMVDGVCMCPDGTTRVRADGTCPAPPPPTDSVCLSPVTDTCSAQLSMLEATTRRFRRGSGEYLTAYWNYWCGCKTEGRTEVCGCLKGGPDARGVADPEGLCDAGTPKPADYCPSCVAPMTLVDGSCVCAPPRITAADGSCQYPVDRGARPVAMSPSANTQRRRCLCLSRDSDDGWWGLHLSRWNDFDDRRGFVSGNGACRWRRAGDSDPVSSGNGEDGIGL